MIKEPSGVYYKIGRTKDFRNRRATFGVQLPFQIEPIAVINTGDMVALEKYLHERFKRQRVSGEWFNLSDRDIEYIKNLCR